MKGRIDIGREWILLTLLFCGLALTSCAPSKMEAKDLVAYVQKENNGLMVAKEIAGIRMEFRFKPVDYLIAREILEGAGEVGYVEKRRSDLDGMYYFDLDISPVDPKQNVSTMGLGSSAEAQSRISYFSFWMKEDLSLQQGEKESRCVLYHYERTSELTPKRKFLLGFPKPQNAKGDITLVLDSGEFGTGKIKVQFDETVINGLPTLIE